MQAPTPSAIFDRALLRQRRERAAAGIAAHTVLFDEAASFLIERLKDVTRTFSSILVLGAGGNLPRRLLGHKNAFIVTTDISLIADDEFLPFAAGSFDLVISNLNLHWVNDLPGVLAQIKYVLKPEGLFLAALLGGGTLHELRSVALLDAEMKVTGGVSPRLSPTLDLLTASALMPAACRFCLAGRRSGNT